MTVHDQLTGLRGGAGEAGTEHEGVEALLEELDQVFSVPTHIHAAYQIKALPHNIKKYIFRMKVKPLPPLYQHEGAIGEKTYAPAGAGH